MPITIKKKSVPAPAPAHAPSTPLEALTASVNASGALAGGKKAKTPPAAPFKAATDAMQQFGKALAGLDLSLASEPVQLTATVDDLEALKKSKTWAGVVQVDTQVSPDVYLGPEVLHNLTDADLADVYGATADRVQIIGMQPVFQQLADAQAELDDRIAAYPPENEVSLTGQRWELKFGKAATAPAKITDLDLARKLLGDSVFMQIASVSLADLRKYLNPEQLAMVLNTDTGYTKKRKFETIYRPEQT